MSDEPAPEWTPETRQRIGERFTSLGKVGFFVQIALLSVPTMFALYMFLLSRGSRSGESPIGFANLISFGSSLVMIFTTYWFYRYIRMGERIKNPMQSPSRAVAVRTLWIGFWAGCLGIVFSLLLLFAAAWRLMFVLLTNPQTGMLVAPTLGTNPTYTISAIDVVSLTSNIANLAAEFVVIGLTLWLLFDLTWPSEGRASNTAVNASN